MARPVSILLSLLLLSVLGIARAELLYFTDFDEFPEGDNKWDDFDGWQETDAARVEAEDTLPAATTMPSGLSQAAFW